MIVEAGERWGGVVRGWEPCRHRPHSPVELDGPGQSLERMRCGRPERVRRSRGKANVFPPGESGSGGVWRHPLARSRFSPDSSSNVGAWRCVPPLNTSPFPAPGRTIFETKSWRCHSSSVARSPASLWVLKSSRSASSSARRSPCRVTRSVVGDGESRWWPPPPHTLSPELTSVSMNL